MTDYITFELQLEAIEDVHIGYGGENELPWQDIPIRQSGIQQNESAIAALRESATNQGNAGYDPVLRNKGGKAVIPVTALKSGLRPNLGDCAEMFLGSAKDEMTGNAGILWLEPGVCESQRVEENNDGTDHFPAKVPPFWEAGRNSFIRPRNRRDAARKTHLFNVEYVPAGSLFSVKVRINSPDKQCAESIISAFAKGIKIGGGTQKSYGALRLVPKDKFTCMRHSISFESDKFIVSETAFEVSATDISPPRPEWIIHLKSDVFYSRDPLRDVQRNKETTSGMLTRGHNSPMITGEMVKYSLRRISARLETADQGSTAAPLTDLLFGTPDFAALLRLHIRDATAASETSWHGLRLCPLSQAPLDSSKFLTESFIGVEFELGIDLDRNRGEVEMTKQKMELSELTNHFNRLKNYVSNRGLKFGAESAAGFGWFTLSNRNSNGCEEANND